MLDRAFKGFDEMLMRAEISTTPLIDMVFLLLIFFAVTTNFTKETGIQVDKAKASTSRIINRNMAIVAIDRSGEFWYDGKPRPVEEIVMSVRAEADRNPELNVVLVPDKDGRVEPLITVMDALRARGVTRFSLGTQAVKREP